jgi:hypothetical protein
VEAMHRVPAPRLRLVPALGDSTLELNGVLLLHPID